MSRQRTNRTSLRVLLILGGAGAVFLAPLATRESVFAACVGLIAVSALGLCATLVDQASLRRKAGLRGRFRRGANSQVPHKPGFRDPLTQTWNRRFLEVEYDALVEAVRKAQRPLHVAVLDIDAFGQLNAVSGREHGDQVLRWVSAAFQGELYSRGYLFRTGGDEFAVILDAEEPEEVIQAALGSLADYAATAQTPDSPVLSVSVGMASLPPDHGVALDAVLRLAADALSRARSHEGRLPGESHVVCVGAEALADDAPGA